MNNQRLNINEKRRTQELLDGKTCQINNLNIYNVITSTMAHHYQVYMLNNGILT